MNRSRGLTPPILSSEADSVVPIALIQIILLFGDVLFVVGVLIAAGIQFAAAVTATAVVAAVVAAVVGQPLVDLHEERSYLSLPLSLLVSRDA